MQQIVSITSQGQITIPALIRRELGLDKYPKASIKTEAGKIVVEPISNIMSLAGILKKKSLKGKSVKGIMKLENEAVAKMIIEKHSCLRR